MANYFAVYKGQEKGLARLALGPEEHPAVTRAVEALVPVFEGRLLREQGLLATPERQQGVLAYVPSDRVRDRVRARWAGAKLAGPDKDLERWRALEEEVATEQGVRGPRQRAPVCRE